MRTWLYIDGYNFFASVKGKKDCRQFPVGLAWCNFRALGQRFLLRPGDTLERIRYFTTLVDSYDRRREEARRQQTWLRAVKTVIPDHDIILGKHIYPPDAERKEKMTDVNIAVHLLLDALDPKGYEKALILSGDLDLFPVALALSTDKRVPHKTIEFWVPPGTAAQPLHEECRWHPSIRVLHVLPAMLYQSRFRDVFEHEGEQIVSEPGWRVPKELATKHGWDQPVGSAPVTC